MSKKSSVHPRPFRVIIGLLSIGLLSIGLLYLGSINSAADSEPLADIYAMVADGQLTVVIPDQRSAPSTTRMIVDLIDPADHVIARQLLLHASQPGQQWQANLRLPANLSEEDLNWDRLRLQCIVKQGGMPAELHLIKEILHRPVLQLLGQSELIAGSENSLRVIVTDDIGTPVTSGKLTLSLHTANNQTISSTSEIDRHGTGEPKLTLPADAVGEAELTITAETPLGRRQTIEKFNLVRRESILLTTDKPIYQPGHHIYIRSLALARFNHQPITNRPITYEIEDARGNKVFKHHAITDQFGVAAAEFQLAEEVNLGSYKLRAILDDPEHGYTQEKNFLVDKYQLPKFRLDVKLGEQEKVQRRDYAPGDQITGLVSANYLFGKPIAQGKLSLQLETSDNQALILNQSEAILDEDGHYHFALKIPEQLPQQTISPGLANLALVATITDSAGHNEKHVESLLVSRDPILITAIAESGEIVPRLTNRIYLLTSYPDGTPAHTHISGDIETGMLETGDDGITSFEWTGNNRPLHLFAKDDQGKTGLATISLKSRPNSSDSLMLRVDRALYQVGDKVRLSVISTRESGSVYLDLIKDRQTVLTKSADLTNGRAKIDLDLSADLFGALELRAYIFSRNGELVGDRRIIFVDPADDLHIETNLAKASFRPGEEAQIDFNVTDRGGQPKSAVLDVQIVDEAVFALREQRPGFEKVFFYLEQELLKPRDELKQFSLDPFVPVSETKYSREDQTRDRHAAVLFAAANETNSYNLRKTIGDPALNYQSSQFITRYYQVCNDKLVRLVNGLVKYYQAGNQPLPDQLTEDVKKACRKGFIQRQDCLDPFGKEWLLIFENLGEQKRYYTRLALPDHTNQLLQYTINQSLLPKSMQDTVKKSPETVTIINPPITQTEPPNANFLNSLSGTVVDEATAVIAGAEVELKDLRNNYARTVVTNDQGDYFFVGVPVGAYYLTVSAEGFNTNRMIVNVTLARPINLPITLRVGSTSDVVEVTGGEIVVESTKTEMSTSIDTRRVDNLPINGRNFLDFSLTSAGALPASQTTADQSIRTRSYFPETLFVNPTLVTDRNGRATIRVPMADSITSWRMTMLASTRTGALGSDNSNLKVFQDFFIDLDLPVSLTQDDTVTIPVAIYNYLPNAAKVELSLQPSDWYQLVDDDPIKQIDTNAGAVTASSYRIRADQIGSRQITVKARLLDYNSTANGDALTRHLEVMPNGKQENITINDRLIGKVDQQIVIPANAISDASKILVKFYPGPISQVVEGVDSILQMPNGCFEQTSSTTYPDVLALDYLKTTRRANDQIRAKAENYISLGYQRLVTFEVRSGGFSLWGQAPASLTLTAYGLMEFSDMSKVFEIDNKIIERTQSWLVSQQESNGSWRPDNYYHSGSNGNIAQPLRATAYLGWALVHSGYQGPALSRAEQFIKANYNGQEDTYTLALLANFAVEYQHDQAWRDRVLEQLLKRVERFDKRARWTTEGQTASYAYGEMAAIETTALVAQALLKAGGQDRLVIAAIDYLISKKDPYGNWHSTQATIQVLKALLMAQRQGSELEASGTIRVAINGQQLPAITITRDDAELLRQLDLKQYTRIGENHIEIDFAGQGALQYQIIGRYYQPWQQPDDQPLSVSVKYDHNQFQPAEIATVTLNVQNHQHQNANMVMVEAGIPPGFELLGEDLPAVLNNTQTNQLGNLTKYSITAKQLILYLDGLSPRQSYQLKYRLRAKYPLKAKTLPTRVYEYYTPQVSATANPVELVVKK